MVLLCEINTLVVVCESPLPVAVTTSTPHISLSSLRWLIVFFGMIHYPKFTGLFSGQYGPLQDDCPVNLDNQKFMARVNMQHKCKIMSYHEIYRIFVLQKIVVHFVRLNQYVVAPHRETPAVGNNIA